MPSTLRTPQVVWRCWLHRVQDGSDYLGERHVSDDLVVGTPAQEWLDPLDVGPDPAQLDSRLSVRVVRPPRHTSEEDVYGCAEKDDAVELPVEGGLVLLAAGDEKDLRVLGVEELLDGGLPPALPPVRLDVAPTFVRVDRLVSPRPELGDHAGLSDPGHARQEDALHVTIIA